MSNKIYCFSLYCEGHGLVKTQVFVSIRGSEQDARDAANRQNKVCFPPELGWHNHQMSMAVIPKETVLLLAAEWAKGLTDE